MPLSVPQALFAALSTAHAVLLVSDASQEYTEPEIQFLHHAMRISPNVAAVLAKTDLYPEWRRIEQIDKAVETLGTDNLVLMHATSTYPLPPEEANLRMITTLQERYQVPVGYSGHERGLQISLAAVALGAVTVERHITLDRTMWGSDQASSLEPKGFESLIRDIRILEEAMGDGVKRVFPGELAPLSRLRRVDA